MKLSKYLKEKYWETIYFNLQAIRRRHAEIIRLSSSVGSKKGYSLYSANFFSEQLIKKYVEKDMLKIHHKTFLHFIKTKYAYIEKVHSRKTFPLSLRDHIFSRDNYCCQLCGISNTVAIMNDHYLEVVHIKDLSEGGNTSFSNGQTICSKCNKGRNSAKKQKTSSKSKRKLIKT
ncbi:HNH endonuclease [Leptospira stimsonii]|uniref:HNH endonuclease n=1 Tax=Leptospira stimsonii TaxID=2202203 RepID=A0ABY2N560_9LEPT|nr:HNH endonuclease [Leptospira stimsonii]TGK23576.1 HNH endonuclease [Leptospira stimsonii]TGM16921.1 HNH endonuclease [Leptospira stimsonii]